MNRFFTSSLAKTATLRNRYARIAVLLTKITTKISQTNWEEVQAGALKEKIGVFMRMAKAYVAGKYRFIPWKVMATLLAALIYFLNPFDFVPDFIPVLGLGDDFAVLMWVYHSIAHDVARFLAWEKTQSIVA
jgi:uncharacterized membrane protein YkvA (DUF1232 family)